MYRCPVSQVDHGSIEVVDAWWAYRGAGGMSPGPLPSAGGWMSQTYWFHRAVAILDDQYAKDHKAIESLRNAK